MTPSPNFCISRSGSLCILPLFLGDVDVDVKPYLSSSQYVEVVDRPFDELAPPLLPVFLLPRLGPKTTRCLRGSGLAMWTLSVLTVAHMPESGREMATMVGTKLWMLEFLVQV